MDHETTIKFLLEQQAAAEARAAADEERHARWHAEFEKNQLQFQQGMLAIEQTQVRQLEMINKLLDRGRAERNN